MMPFKRKTAVKKTAAPRKKTTLKKTSAKKATLKKATNTPKPSHAALVLALEGLVKGILKKQKK